MMASYLESTNPHSTSEAFLRHLKKINRQGVNPLDPELVQEQNTIRFATFIARFNEDLLFRLNLLREFHLIEILFGSKKSQGKLAKYYREMAEEFENARRRQLYTEPLLNIVKKHADLHQHGGMSDALLWESFTRDIENLIRQRSYNHQQHLEFERKLYVHHANYMNTLQKSYNDPRHTAFAAQMQALYPAGVPKPNINPVAAYNETLALFNENVPLTEEQTQTVIGNLYSMTEDNKAFQEEIANKDYLLSDGNRDWVAMAKDKEEITSRRNMLKELFEKFVSIPEAIQTQTQKLVQTVFKDRLALEKEIDAELEELEAVATAELKQDREAMLVESKAEVMAQKKSLDQLIDMIGRNSTSQETINRMKTYQKEINDLQKVYEQETEPQALANHLKNYLAAIDKVIVEAEQLPAQEKNNATFAKTIDHLKQRRTLLGQNLRDLEEQNLVFRSVLPSAVKNENELTQQAGIVQPTETTSPTQSEELADRANENGKPDEVILEQTMDTTLLPLSGAPEIEIPAYQIASIAAESAAEDTLHVAQPEVGQASSLGTFGQFKAILQDTKNDTVKSSQDSSGSEISESWSIACDSITEAQDILEDDELGQLLTDMKKIDVSDVNSLKDILSRVLQFKKQFPEIPSFQDVSSAIGDMIDTLPGNKPTV